jgi:hypothetical protein
MAWKTCPLCRQGYVDELPQGWSYTVTTFDDGISHVFIHDKECPDRFKTVEVPDGD